MAAASPADHAQSSVSSLRCFGNPVDHAQGSGGDLAGGEDRSPARANFHSRAWTPACHDGSMSDATIPDTPDTPRSRLADRTPFPDDLDGRLREQFTFLVEVDRLKTIVRQSPLASADRRENDAEHSWHLAMMVLVLAEHSDEPDRRRAHGARWSSCTTWWRSTPATPRCTTPAPGWTRRPGRCAAADELFGLLPGDQARAAAGAVGRVRGARDARGAVRQGDGPAPAAPAQLDGAGRHLADTWRHRRRRTRPQGGDRGRLDPAVDGGPAAHRRGRVTRLVPERRRTGG